MDNLLASIQYIEAGGKKYPVAFTLNVMSRLQKKYGNLDEITAIFNSMSDANMDLEQFISLFAEMLNEGAAILRYFSNGEENHYSEDIVGWLLTEMGLENAKRTVAVAVNEALTNKVPKGSKAGASRKK